MTHTSLESSRLAELKCAISPGHDEGQESFGFQKNYGKGTVSGLDAGFGGRPNLRSMRLTVGEK